MQPANSPRPEAGGSQDVFYAVDNAVPLPIIARTKGIYMWDEEGNEYIDLSSGPVVSNIGHGNEYVADAMAKQARQMDFAYSRVCRHRPNIDLADRICDLAGPGFERVSFTSGGSEAMEIAIKFLRQYAIANGQQDRNKLITCQPSYHGGTIAMLGITGDEALEPFLRDFAVSSAKIPAPLSYRPPEGYTAASYADHCADALEARIIELGADNVLGFIIEPVGGLATGCVVPPDNYFRRIREICTRHRITLVFDEILCGTGRTGRFLAAHHWPDALPDMVVMAKGLCSGYAPLGAVLFPADKVDHLASQTGFNFSHTYNANPITCATAMAVLDEYQRLDLIDAAEKRGHYLKHKLLQQAAHLDVLGDIRGLGLVMAVEMVADKTTREKMPNQFFATERVRQHGLNNGLIIYSRRTADARYGDWFMLSPPLTISEEECDELVTRLVATLEDLQAELNGAA